MFGHNTVMGDMGHYSLMYQQTEHICCF